MHGLIGFFFSQPSDGKRYIEAKKQGVPYEYYINKGMGHWYPKDIEGKLEKALKFIMEQ